MPEEEIAYQSEQEVSQEPQIDAVDDTQEPVTTQDEYDIIKYNKEEVKIPVSERQSYLQKGYNYDKVQQKATELEGQVKYLEKRARQEGFNDVQSYLKAIDDYENQQQIEIESSRMGVDPETYAQYFAPVNQEVSQLRQEVQTYRDQMTAQQQQEQTVKQWGSLYESHPSLAESSEAFNEGKDPEWFTPQMKELVNKGYDPLHAYELAHKDTLVRQQEQAVIARLTGRDMKQVLSSKDSPNNMQFDPSNMSDAQIQDISRRVQRGERITF